MSEKAGDAGAVSWKLFNDLYESQYDLFRKLRFIVKAGKVNAGESIALEMIDDYLKRKEVELKDFRQAGLEEWTARGKAVSLQPAPAVEAPKNKWGLGPGKALVPVVPESRVSFLGRLMSRARKS